MNLFGLSRGDAELVRSLCDEFEIHARKKDALYTRIRSLPEREYQQCGRALLSGAGLVRA